MVRVAFDSLRTSAACYGGRWQDCSWPPLLDDLNRRTSAACLCTGDVELEAARLAIEAWGGRVVELSVPRPRVLVRFAPAVLERHTGRHAATRSRY